MSALLLVMALVPLGSATAEAQDVPPARTDQSIGEVYWVEGAFDFWMPSPNMLIQSESLGIPGTVIDAVSDLGIQRTKFRQLDLVLRPAKKHKFYLAYTPIKYEASNVISRRLVFNGIAYQIGLPVDSTLQWNAWRFGYEYDFLYMKRGFVGVLFEAKYTDVEVDLTSLIAREYARAAAPVPAIGGIGRAYVAPNVAVTFEVSGIGLPGKIGDDVEASYIEYDFYGTFNFNRYVGARVGFRALDVHYKIDLDQGDFTLKGPYFGVVARF
jgi:hypothetical protein